jgi:hypothetical protein
VQSRDFKKAKDQIDAKEKTITDLATKIIVLTIEIKAQKLKFDKETKDHK